MLHKDIQERFAKLLGELQTGIYEKEREMALALLAAVAGENVLLLGPPGVAKSMIARRMKDAFQQARTFDYLMTRFSTPDELFGPVSIQKLKSDDSYERRTEGFLPTADIAFLDEIWKAGPAILNALLTLINERTFRNGNQEVNVPLKLLVGASNELPAKGEGLEALWDRFLVRLVCRGVQSADAFRQLLTAPEADAHPTCPLSETELMEWRQAVEDIALSESVIQAIDRIRQSLQSVSIAGSTLPRAIYVSDRRWRHIANLLRASALVQGRKCAELDDLLPIYHCLWSETDEIEPARALTLNAILHDATERIDNIAAAVATDLRRKKATVALQRAAAAGDRRDEGLYQADGCYYQVENHGTGHSFIPIADFKRLPEHRPGDRSASPIVGMITNDATAPSRCLIKPLENDDESKSIAQGLAERVTLARDNTHLFINGIAYKMRSAGVAAFSPAAGKRLTDMGHSDATPTADDAWRYDDQIADACDALDALGDQLLLNLFLDHTDRQLVEAEVKRLRRHVALTRAEIAKLHDE